MIGRILAVALLLATACKEAPSNAVEAPAARAKAPAKAAPAAAPAKAHQVHEESDLLEFIYGWSAEAAAIPALKARFEADLQKQRTEALDYARQDKAERGADVPYHGHYYSKVWETQGDSRRLLSLAAQIGTFTGGAHGNSFYETLLWDRELGRVVEVADLFTNAEAAFAAMNQPYCDDLNAQRAEKRQEKLPLEGPDWMVQCRPLGEQTVAAYDSNDDGTFDTMRVLIEPYNSGPYAEGEYVVDVPVTDAVRRLLKKEYEAAFAG